MAYASQPADLIYSLTKAMIASYDAYKDAAPGAAGLALDRQNFAWVIPYHEGAVRALKEAGVWKAEHEAHNQKLLQAPGDARRRLGRLPEEQSARRQGGVHQGLDGRAQRRAEQDRPGPGVLIGRRRAAARRAGRDRCPAPKRRAAIAVEFADPHAQAGPVEAEVIRVRRLAGVWRWLLIVATGADDLPLHQPAIHAALLHRLHAAQHRIFLSAHSVHAAVHVPDLSGNGYGVARSRSLVRHRAVRRDDRVVRLPDAQRPRGGRARLGVLRRADAGRRRRASPCG